MNPEGTNALPQERQGRADDFEISVKLASPIVWSQLLDRATHHDPRIVNQRPKPVRAGLLPHTLKRVLDRAADRNIQDDRYYAALLPCALCKGRDASATKASPSSARRTPAMTLNPSLASLSEVALPIPVDVPVTRANLVLLLPFLNCRLTTRRTLIGFGTGFYLIFELESNLLIRSRGHRWC